MSLLLSKIRMFSAPEAKPLIEVPAATGTHFYTAGRILSFFPQVNLNGYCFRKEDCAGIAKTLLASTVDLQHVKKGYGVKDPLVAGQDNVIVGAICDVLEHDEGIDICVKIERSVAQSFGFTPEDFEPGKGLLSTYSQECEYNPLTGQYYVVVDKDDPSKIVKTISYEEGQNVGLNFSKVINGDWLYSTVEDNPVYMAVKPSSFSGVGHVQKPADPSAITYRMAASQGISFVPGMDTDDGPVSDMAKPFMVAEYEGNDLNNYTQDFVAHPDLLSAIGDKFHGEKDDPEAPDDHYAASYMDHKYETQQATGKDGAVTTTDKYTPTKVRAMRIKDKKGNFDRPRLVAAYHSLMGLRGDINGGHKLPFRVRQHALARVRQGLTATKEKINKELSSHPMEETVEALNARIRELSALKETTLQEIEAMKNENTTLKSSLEGSKSELTTRDEQIATLTASLNEAIAKIKEFTDKEVSATRLAALEAVAPFSETEKADEKFGEFVKALASMDDAGLKIAVLERTVAKLSAPQPAQDRVLASLNVGILTNPVPAFQGGSAPALPTHADLY